jgi:integrase
MKNLRDIAFPPDDVLDAALTRVRMMKAERPATISTADAKERSKYQKRNGLKELSRELFEIRWTNRAGKQQKKHIRGPKSQAKKILAIHQSESARGVKPIACRAVSFDKLADLAEAHIKASYADPDADLGRVTTVREWFSGTLADEVTTLDIRNALANGRKAKNWSDASVNRHHSVISLCFRLGLEANLIATSPIHGKLKKTEELNDRDRHLTDDEESRLFAALRSNPGWALHGVEVTFALVTGLRRGDMYRRLKWENVDLLKRTARIPRSKNGKPLTIFLNADAIACLNVWRSRGDGTGRVVRNAEGEELDGNNDRWFPPAVKQAGIPDFRWHDLRHTFASRLRQKGVPLEDIAQLLGHSRKTGLSMTLRYATQSQDNLAGAVAKLEEIRPELGRDEAVPAKTQEIVN